MSSTPKSALQNHPQSKNRHWKQRNYHLISSISSDLIRFPLSNHHTTSITTLALTLASTISSPCQPQTLHTHPSISSLNLIPINPPALPPPSPSILHYPALLSAKRNLSSPQPIKPPKSIPDSHRGWGPDPMPRGKAAGLPLPDLVSSLSSRCGLPLLWRPKSASVRYPKTRGRRTHAHSQRTHIQDYSRIR
ncbi:hypothetical protein BCR34DRAFT_275859 [Clohesyomyces aquaticus]|uniref:Uncharacterized protein n=1 Tax=Clohesyomyces aquaticus TaxID=1231657 RepID=A0A1Y1ZT14_9PLEO|nr:hypothetical protein BCR34DRAFT_275859 [Clohesyomyces aquaticus]